MQTRPLGKTSLQLPVLGLGCMGMSEFYGETDDAESIQVIHRALARGCNHLDTADIYGIGRNEELVGKAIKDRRDEVFLATKFGIVRDPANPAFRGVNGNPDYLRRACDNSLQRLKVEHIDLYYQHRPDPQVDIQESVGAMAELVKAGKVRYLGLSEVSPEQLRKACAVHPIAALQSEYSLWTRELEAEMLPLCRELGVTLVAYSPLGRGFLSGKNLDARKDPKDFRHNLPRFQGENLTTNQKLLAGLEDISAQHGCSPAQLALAWVLAQGEEVVAIPGTKRLKYLEENLDAADIRLSQTDVEQLNQLFAPEKVAGERYPVGYAINKK